MSDMKVEVKENDSSSDEFSKRRVKKRVLSGESDSQFKRARTVNHPRWHNQSYMLFLALRQHNGTSLPRGELIKRALALDRKISAELNLPKVFRGKTPGNSASAILTNNSDHYFVSFKPEGSRSTWFKLAYEPGNVDTAVAEYQKWLKKLVEHDWPYCFGVPLKNEAHYHTPVSDADPTDEVIESDKDPVDKSENDSEETTVDKSENDSEETTVDKSENDSEQTTVVTVQNDRQEKTTVVTVQNDRQEKTTVVTVQNDRQEKTTSTEPPHRTHESLDQLDLSDIPKRWSDIVEIQPSRIPGAGNGLFAKRKLPYNTPIGFYFGVPMTEDEFDSLKDRVGRSSEYSIMYRRTVLDATDEQGEPITDVTSDRFCAFHFMNETVEGGANVAFVEGAIVNQVICWTRKDIEVGEELLVWYGADVNRYWKDGEKSIDDGSCLIKELEKTNLSNPLDDLE